MRKTLLAIVAAAVVSGVVALIGTQINMGLPTIQDVEGTPYKDKPVVMLLTTHSCNVFTCGEQEKLLLTEQKKHPDWNFIKFNFALSQDGSSTEIRFIMPPPENGIVYSAEDFTLTAENVDRVMANLKALEDAWHQRDAAAKPFDDQILVLRLQADAAIKAKKDEYAGVVRESEEAEKKFEDDYHALYANNDKAAQMTGQSENAPSLFQDLAIDLQKQYEATHQKFKERLDAIDKEIDAILEPFKEQAKPIFTAKIEALHSYGVRITEIRHDLDVDLEIKHPNSSTGS
jgi:hypothetical protein